VGPLIVGVVALAAGMILLCNYRGGATAITKLLQTYYVRRSSVLATQAPVNGTWIVRGIGLTLTVFALAAIGIGLNLVV
jgi:hypothetical protein